MRTITDKMNEIELQTRELLEKAQFLEGQKNMMSNLMDCNVQGHEWILRNVESDPVSYTHLTLPTICSV